MTGLHCLLYGAHSTRRGHMLSDDSGMGKSILTFEVEARRKEMQLAGFAAGKVVDMRPSIILCPAHVLNVEIRSTT